MKRFLRYALAHGRKIRAVFMQNGEFVQKTVSVLAYDDQTLQMQIGKKVMEIPIADLLSCDYARGDHGEE